MKTILPLVFFLIISVASGAQNYHYPGPLEIRGYKIGDKVDTTLFKRYANLYFPNYLDGWTMENTTRPRRKYQGLPIAIWMLKKDSAVVLTLLGNIILNITVSYMDKAEKLKMEKLFSARFGGDGRVTAHEEPHPLQEWVTYWNLITWETRDAIAQIGTEEMRKPKDASRKIVKWNLVYSDFILEDKIISDFRKGH